MSYVVAVIAGLSMIISVYAASANEDAITLSSQGKVFIASVDGQSQGAAGELFGILHNGGAKTENLPHMGGPKGVRLVGNFIQCSEWSTQESHASHFSATIITDTTKALHTIFLKDKQGKVQLYFRGPAAAELLDFMLKANFPSERNDAAMSVQVHGDFVFCMSMKQVTGEQTETFCTVDAL